MFKILIDTCVWLDLAKDHRQETLLTSLETLVKEKEVSLIMPRIVLTEFARNKARIIEDSKRSLSSTLKNARTLLWELEERQRGQSSTFDRKGRGVKAPHLTIDGIKLLARMSKETESVECGALTPFCPLNLTEVPEWEK